MTSSKRRFSNITKTTATLTLLLVFVTCSIRAYSQADDPQYIAGEQVFNNICSTCHYPTEKINAAPGLAGVAERWPSEDLLKLWIKNPNAAIATGDSYVQEMVDTWQGRFGLMVAQPVNDEQVENLLFYINNYVPPVEEAALTTVVDGDGGQEDEGVSWLWFLILGLLFSAIILSLSGVNRQLSNAQLVTQGKEPLPQRSYTADLKDWAWNNKTFVSIVGIFLSMWLIAWLYGLGMDDVGVYGGKEDPADNYRPEQPIKFSHALHAGENEIACIYCHSTAEKSKTPSIPSVNVCMNCHVAINEGPQYGTEEIAKIYQAIGFDPESKTYIENYKESPIKWVKVHDLPDHVYFNHSQHVVVAELECEECHGNVEEMEVIEQVQPLTMGWCIECHNETKVQMADNGYYDEIHHRLMDHENGRKLLREYLEDGSITARELGGWECSKCHY